MMVGARDSIYFNPYVMVGDCPTVTGHDPHRPGSGTLLNTAAIAGAIGEPADPASFAAQGRSPGDTGVQFDLHSLLRIARRWWILLLLAPIIGGMTAYTMSSRQPEMYAAEATLLVNSGVNGTGNVDSIRAGQNLLDTYSMWIVSRPVLERVTDALDDAGGVGSLEDKITTRPIENTLFIKIEVRDNDPARAALIANTVADEFVRYVGEQTDTQNAEYKSSITGHIDETSQEIAGLDDEISSLQAREGTLSIADQNQLTTLLTTRSRLERDLAQLQATSSSLDVELASSRTQILVSAPAIEPGTPYAPNVTRAVAIGIAVGLVLAFAGSILIEYLDNTIRTREEIVKITGSPLLATVASAPEVQREGRPLFVLGSPMSGPSEAMRLLRTNLTFACAPENRSTIVVSSAGPEEGKSTLTANLAVVMAQAGLKTVVIDADLRRPSQHQIFGLHNDLGLTSILTRPDMDWRDGAVPLSIPGMWVIPSGPLPPNPADLLGLPKFGQLLDSIKETADVVLIDSAPALAVSDALIVAKKADGAVLVCRPGQTRRDALKRAAAAFGQGNIPLMGFVLNRVKSDIDEYDGYEQTTSDTRMPSARFYYGDNQSELPAPRSIFSAGRQKPEKSKLPNSFMANEM